MKKATLIYFEYEDGTADVAEGQHAEQIQAYLDGAQVLADIHGARYQGQIMRLVPAGYLKKAEAV